MRQHDPVHMFLLLAVFSWLCLGVGCDGDEASEPFTDVSDVTETRDASDDETGGDADDSSGDSEDADATDTDDSLDVTDATTHSDSSDAADDGGLPDGGADTVDAVDATSDSQDAADASDSDGDASELGPLAQRALDLHNGARLGSLNPTPNPSLPPVTWDDELASVAQDYAELCIWGHNGNRSSDYANSGGSGSVGENLSAGYGASNLPMESFFSGWVDEADDYNYGNNSCPAGAQCGHYTQVVWRQTTRVGCGWAQCPRLEGITDPRWVNVWILVCNYSPAGNNGNRPY